MTSNAEASIQRLESSTQQPVGNSSDVNLPTQLSICDASESLILTSNRLEFTCQTNNNSNGNLLFPLGEIYEYTTKHSQKMSWHSLLKHLKSQRIVKDIKMFNKLKRKQQHVQNIQQFPFKRDQRYKENFQFVSRNTKQFHTPMALKRKEFKNVTKFKFPLKVATGKALFLHNDKGIREKTKTADIIKTPKVLQMDLKFKQRLKIMQNLKKITKATNLKRFPCIQDLNNKVFDEFPLQNQSNSFNRSNEKPFKFPLTSQNMQSFPFANKSPSKNNLKFNSFEQQFQIMHTSKAFSNATYIQQRQLDQKFITTFPCELYLKSQLAHTSHISTFPLQNPEINNKYTQLKFSSNNYLNSANCSKINNSNNTQTSLASSYSPSSLAMTQNGQKFKNIYNEYVSQVQDAQVCVEENSPALTVAQNKQPPLQTTMAKTIYDDDDDDENILAAINSINNTRPSELGYYAEKIERIQDAIVVLFKKIQNSLTTNHNSVHDGTNAVKQDGNARFALTPPTSVTSVRNTERTDTEEVLHNKYDLGDLCDRQVGQIVERSDVRDTLAEAVEYGVTKAQTNSTGSFLAKSEEPTSPNSPAPNPSNDSILYTSLEDYTNASELLPKYNVLAVNKEINVDVKNNLEFDSIETIDTGSKLNEIYELTRETPSTVTNTCVKNLSSVKVNEMTVSRLADNEQENTNKDLQLIEALEHRDNIFSNDLQIDEMKFEMNRVKGALPSSVSERALGKREHSITGSENTPYGRHAATNVTRLSTETPLSNNRLPSSLSSIRNYNDSSYTPRSALTNESSALVSKRSTINAHLPQDTITNRLVLNTPSLGETISNRAATNSTRNSNDTTFNALSNRRPSLGALRNTQSTSLLSVDLPRYTPLTTASHSDQTPSVSRAVSIDSTLGDVLPEKTRLRRQRRLRTQDSQDECEDPIERLNRLKARISASLSEVKGVLKQYSTENETENDTGNQTATLNNLKDIKEEENHDEGPVMFRFVKKVRRRSLFTEEEKNEQKEKEKNAELSKDKHENHLEKHLNSKDETDNIKLKIGSTLPTKNSEISQEELQTILEKQVQNKFENTDASAISSETNEVQINTNLCTLKKKVQEFLEETKPTEIEPAAKVVKPNENDKTAKDKPQPKGAIPKLATKLNNTSTHETTTKTKKKMIIKSKDPARRASLAAVEASKIEPAVKVDIPAKFHRRPSDSEAVVKKNLLTAKINTSGIVEEVTPKPKIVKVKRPSVKNKNNSQLATVQSKLKEEDDGKSDDYVKSIDEDNKSIHTDKNKDVLMPKQPEQQQQQQQNNTEITSQRNSLLPTQLVIDEAASLSVKTIKNSVPPPRQQQQQQQQQLEQKQERQATIKSTTTNFKSNDLQVSGGMLESVKTVLSSSTASEANGQIKRENVVQPDDLRDLLQSETTIIKPSATNKQHELNLVNKVGNQQSEIKDLPVTQASKEKFKENLEIHQTATQELQQKPSQQQQQQQVVATNDIVIARSVDNDKHDDVKVKTSLKEPCIDKTSTSTHVGSEHPQHHHHHHQQLVVEGEQSITNVADTKTISSPHISTSSTADITQKTTDSAPEEKSEGPANQQNTMPELQLAPAPVQTAHIISHPEHHKKKVILKKIIRQTSADKSKKTELATTKSTEDVEQAADKLTAETPSEAVKDELTEECSESTEISESSASAEVAATEKPKKERKVKKKVIIKRQKRRLSIGDTFFHTGVDEATQNTETETLEKTISYVTDDEADDTTDKPDEDENNSQEQEEQKKPLKSCIMHKEYHIGDEVLYAERFKKTQIKWRRGRIKERITSISYLLDIDGKDVSSHINYLKKYTARKVSFGGKEYLEIDYEQLAEEEEKAERLQKRTISIWNMV